MLNLDITGRDKVDLKYLLLDFNGTIAFDGTFISELAPIIERVRKEHEMEIYILTADTFGTAKEQTDHLPLSLKILESDNHTREKGDFVQELGAENVIAIGNGANDIQMLKEAEISIGILGQEGCSTGIVDVADLFVADIVDGLELLLHPKRLMATLRR